MINIEAAVISWLNSDENLKDAKAAADVPATRPNKFITVELTGGARSRYRATPLMAIKCYAGSRYEASELAENLVMPRLLAMPWGVDEIADVNIESIYNNPEPGPPLRPRYQINITITHSM